MDVTQIHVSNLWKGTAPFATWAQLNDETRTEGVPGPTFPPLSKVIFGVSNQVNKNMSHVYIPSSVW